MDSFDISVRIRSVDQLMGQLNGLIRQYINCRFLLLLDISNMNTFIKSHMPEGRV
jgi:hypothetical protein